MIPLIGYCDRLSGRPGDKIEFKVSSTETEPYKAWLVRSVSADPNPAGPGIIEEEIAVDFAGAYPSRIQPFFPGSYARITPRRAAPAIRSFTVAANIWPTLPGNGREQAVFSWNSARSEDGFVLMLDADGRPSVRIGDARGHAVTASTDRAVKNRAWVRIWASFDADEKRLEVGVAPLENAARPAERSALTVAGFEPAAPDSDLLIAAMAGGARSDAVTGCFNGKIEAPVLFGRAVTPEEMAGLGGGPAEGVLAQWDFARGTTGTGIEDIGPSGLHGELVNLPARAMTGSNWTAREMCWRHAPAEYGAIHFHDDDIYDFGWETDFTFEIPETLKPGIYAARLSCNGQEDAIPFFVLPPKGRRQADLCVLVSTFTYSVYGNHARPDFEASWKDRFATWNAYPWNPAEHLEYGLSTYNFHSDGSGICHASHRRPLMNLRPGYVTYGYGESSGLRHFQADSHLIAWLEAKGLDYDIVTDQELHDEGVSAIDGYAAVTTGSHPEYHTRETLDALTDYRDQGGKLLYLGGNGFYWRVALHESEPGAIEIRRAEGGIRAWAAEPGEYFNAFDGAYGGLWRRSGRPPQKIAGVGFSAQGQFEGSYYRRNRKNPPPSAAWVFEGIEDEILGDFGLSGGGAAGFELDRADVRLGSPENIEILASSEGHSDAFVLVPEEQLTHITNWPGEPVEHLLRADMTYFELPGGGAVFSTGSITFCGSLPHNNFENNISRLLENVIRHFLKKA
ncbi:N,N-dimethylformamidase beta subunit family domain-containing protein [Denitrobaculum tricleocarpae]|uniref:LamG domain-containing protein n=1 Tax=Denitrobaculum tricleocarpae TaxID=2591009 RepID=A0A545U0Z0_9PROT|nr:N,N-dimethylformamidase beta subunit family domain-containing protein [Denitrobaculum tricleocarpae]TQV83126.1 LamG domain-containing protein [Denitrobaculum tricleocarpae]